GQTPGQTPGAVPGQSGGEQLAAGAPPQPLAAPGTTPEPTAASSNPAVVTLLNTANAQVQAGELQQAAATLERALQIDPESAWIWHRLAQVRLRQGQLDQSVNLASKSNSLAAGDVALQADNWDLIAEARRRQGAAAAAATAEAQARSLRQR
ncbi:MAG: tetratricopeptide repeat protein, partial [Gammaproteobacteria bacterium]|nr:tetratricopeptide repeat protein [Gammaproteobacteria bacterium]